MRPGAANIPGGAVSKILKNALLDTRLPFELEHCCSPRITGRAKRPLPWPVRNGELSKETVRVVVERLAQEANDLGYG